MDSKIMQEHHAKGHSCHPASSDPLSSLPIHLPAGLKHLPRDQHHCARVHYASCVTRGCRASLCERVSPHPGSSRASPSRGIIPKQRRLSNRILSHALTFPDLTNLSTLRRSRIFRALMPPDQLNPEGFIDGSNGPCQFITQAVCDS